MMVVGSLLSNDFQDVHVVVDPISFVSAWAVAAVSVEFKYVIGSNPVAQSVRHYKTKT